jgi:hypothetical protein
MLLSDLLKKLLSQQYSGSVILHFQSGRVRLAELPSQQIKLQHIELVDSKDRVSA